MSLLKKLGENLRAANIEGAKPGSFLTAYDVFEAVAQDGFFGAKLSDAEMRPSTVTFQAYAEATIVAGLRSGDIYSAAGMIHTPKPATPLLSDGDITEGLVTEAIAQDPARLETVTKRINVVRDFMSSGGKLIALYPKEHAPITPEQLEVFDAVKRQYPDNLIDAPIGRRFDSALSGATYLIQNMDGTRNVFSIKASQANGADEENLMEWGVWLGNPETDDVVGKRLVEINDAFIDDAYLPALVNEL